MTIDSIMQEWFLGVTLPKLTVQITSDPSMSYCGASMNGACWKYLVGNISIVVPDKFTNDKEFEIRSSLAVEVTEQFMRAQDSGWDWLRFDPQHGTEGTVGEGLSIFLSQQLMIRQGLQPDYKWIANQWLKSTRLIEPQTLSFTEAHGPSGTDINSGFYLLFFYYLKDQLGHSIYEIVHSPPHDTGKIAEVYRYLTRNATDPFPDFIQLINEYSPFPLPLRRYRSTTNSSVSAVSRKFDTMELWWVGAEGSIQGAYWYENTNIWTQYQLASAGSASTG